jgi:hypothetical protein
MASGTQMPVARQSLRRTLALAWAVEALLGELPDFNPIAGQTQGVSNHPKIGAPGKRGFP